MKIKKITAPTMPEAMKLVREQLGQDAIILNSKVVMHGGFLGLFKKKSIEVIAALDEPTPMNEQLPDKQVVPVKAQKVTSINKVTPLVKNETNIQNLDDRIEEKEKLDASVSYLVASSIQSIESNTNLKNKVISTFKAQELEDEIIYQLMKNITSVEDLDEEQVLSLIRSNLEEELSSLTFGGISFDKKYINVVGPTGVGKTTTLAKIAAQCVLKHKKKVAFITTDTYRISAIDQLKTYAQILSVPLEVCYNMEDFKGAQEKFADYDIVFIDTAGRNFTKGEYVEDLKKTIDFSNEVETFLVLALTSKYSDMKNIYKQFSIIPIDRVIFTKKDETSSYGSMVNIVLKHKIGVAYITNGQNVPDDLIEVKKQHVVDTLIEGYNHERSS